MSEKRRILLNTLTSVVSQAVIIVFGLIVPRIVLLFYGSDVNGLTSTITQIFSYLALLEAGISVAARNSLFKPIKENDRNEISRVVSLAKRYYEKVTVFYIISIFVIASIAPLILKTSVDYLTIFAYIVFQGLSNAVLFFFVQKWNAVLSAYGKNYIINTVTVLCKTLAYAIYIVLISLRVNIAFVQLGFLVVSLSQLLVFYLYMRTHYGWINYHAFKKGDSLKDKNEYLISEVAWTIFSSTDMIILSIFVSTSIASVYSIYNLVFLALSNILNSIFTALVYRLGAEYHKGIERYSKLHDNYISVFHGAMTAFMCVCFALVNSFVALYTKGVDDVQYVYPQLPLLFCLVQIISWSRYVPGSLVGISGRQKDTIFVNVLEAALNVGLSLVLVFFFGIVGVLIATVVVIPIKVFYCIFIADIKVMKRSMFKTLRIILPNFILFALTAAIFSLFPIAASSYIELILLAAVMLLGFAAVVFALSLLTNSHLRTRICTLFKREKR